ncbi:MAG: glycoside hydrolase family 2 protein, partial [Planctomycetota bacterium]
MLGLLRMVMGVVLLAAGAVVVLGQETETLYLSGEDKDTPVEWEFYCTAGRNSSEWTTIGVPSNWELQGFGTYNYGQDVNKANEQGRYRRSFRLPDNWRDKIIHIVFEGVMTDTQVWVNGNSASPKHQGGFYRFKYDITELVKFDSSNLLEVTVSKVSSNGSVEVAERKADYWVFGGIYRPVYLEAFPHQFIEWAAVDAQADGTISVDVYLKNITNADQVIGSVSGPEIAGAEALSARVVEGQDKVTLEGKVADVKPWTAESPYIYGLELSLMRGRTVLHRTSERFGFRTFEVRPGSGLFLNGRKIRLKGVNRHCFWPDSGRCLSRQVSYDDVRLIKQMNMNAVRMSHYPPDVHFLKACDELGLYVLDELAGWQKPPYDTQIGKKLVRELVVRDVSHPCILFW